MNASTWLPLASPLLTLAGALLLDRFVGEPPNAVHPVAWMGHAIEGFKWLFFRGGPRVSLGLGVIVALALPFAFALASRTLLSAVGTLPWLQVALGALLLKSTFALRALGEAGRGVRKPLSEGDLARARVGLRSLCSRNPSALGPASLVAATVESLAENTSDSVVAPLFWFALFGVPGAVFYRAVNTLDAMVGYHGRFEYFGKASARLDDLMNVVPARLTALLLLASGAARGFDGRRGARVLLRDGGNTESPNAGRPMAAMAGLLGVSLVKEGHYALGDALHPLEPAHIDRAWKIAAPAGLLSALLAACAKACFSWFGARHGF